MKKFMLIGAVIAVIGVGAFALSRVFAKQRGAWQNAETVKVVRRNIRSVVKATGVIKPMVGAEVRVGSTVSGVVSHLLVRIGDRVQKGAVLAEIDSRELVARHDAAQAAVRLANANVSYTTADLRRKQELSAAQVISKSELDLAQQAFAVAEQQYRQAEANLADAATQLGYARVVAPITGIVESVSTQEGETVAASFAAPTFVTLLDLSRLEVWTYVDETDIGRVQVGQKATFTVDTYADQTFPGKVTAIYPQAQIRDNVVDYMTVVRFRPPRDYILRPEMTTTVQIVLEQHQNVLALPLRAVRRDAGSQYVTVRNGNTAERRPVTTGLTDDSYCEIVSGLRENDEVLIEESKDKRQTQ